ncbi:AAA family ATPase [Paenibacillus sp. ISL-20]|uniref:AAA family ATPase n=1 Tax=Paenibacillus sp. ISL-20 TaxID=2819163 RepID=UPI001BE676B5|nr:AAA family ATPase [Paenibacillus sp. ISL-20]MBT2765386.1 AAA family ATPase [Paenibacillus sp. ISL-20]
MIPWRLRFHGIRDYGPTELDLTGQQEHVIITGPNGAGKSTITYCMGAVLYSAKVEVDGLRSRNLAHDETWKAHIRFLFKNSGSMRIDAPDFIEFSLHIQQEPGQPFKKEYVISFGDRIDEWEDVIRYTSGDRQYNFTAYKKDLQYKYRIDPDLFYLIWYQQEVNQFAVKNPMERFREFAEMYGIDQIQRNWEESMARQKETQETLRLAENNVLYQKQTLQRLKTDLERYESNQKRLIDGGKRYSKAMLQLEDAYKKEIRQLCEQIDQLLIDRDEQQERIHEAKAEEVEAKEDGVKITANINQLQDRLKLEEEQLSELEDQLKQVKTMIDELGQELHSISKEKEQITRTETEVKHQLEQVSRRLNEVKLQEARLQQSISENDNQSVEATTQIANLRALIDKDRAEEQVYQELLDTYISSHAVQQEMDRLESSINTTKDKLYDGKHQVRELQEELERLENNQDWSHRQLESLKYFQAKGIRAYPLRDLVELNNSAQLKAEELFNSMKYTVFFDGNESYVPNDLYHVPLRKVVPDRSVTELPELQLQVKGELSQETFPYAVKALWWIEQFFTGDELQIRQGMLIDQRGIRGQQEKNRYILSARAMIARKAQVQTELDQGLRAVEAYQESLQKDNKQLQLLNGMIQQVRQAESFQTKEHERVNRMMKSEQELRRREELAIEKKKIQENIDVLKNECAERSYFIGILQQEADFYLRLGELKEKYEQLHQYQRNKEMLLNQVEGLKQQMETGEDQLDKLERESRKQERRLQEIQYAKDREVRKLSQIENQMTSRREQLDTRNGEQIHLSRELEDFKILAPSIYNEVLIERQSQQEGTQSERRISSSAIHSELESGRVTFDHARRETGIDPAAPENYKTAEKEFHRTQDEFSRTSLLFEEDRERTEELADQLETTINMRVLEIRQRFKTYMSLFQFEGEIEWEKLESHRDKRPNFHLYIKARKEGHRGALEDVSIKGRGGRVGKGVSGGEESLSSLLFALALLQNLQTAPGFIVLDEFDSALDEQRKLKVFDLYQQELKRKLIILTPKSHEQTYLDRFALSYIVQHDPTVPKSRVIGIKKRIEVASVN